MRIHRYTTYLLIGYLSVLLNVGPSAHHADFLGLHAHGGCCEVVSFSQDDCSACCCDSEHVEADSERLQSVVAISDGATQRACDDCALCQYFDYFSAIVTTVDFDVAESQGPGVVASGINFIPAISIECSARGPPATALS